MPFILPSSALYEAFISAADSSLDHTLNSSILPLNLYKLLAPQPETHSVLAMFLGVVDDPKQ